MFIEDRKTLQKTWHRNMTDREKDIYFCKMWIVSAREHQKIHEIIVKYYRDGGVYYDEHYYHGDSQEGALKRVKKDWHERNDNLFPGAVNAEFFVKVDDHER